MLKRTVKNLYNHIPFTHLLGIQPVYFKGVVINKEQILTAIKKNGYVVLSVKTNLLRGPGLNGAGYWSNGPHPFVRWLEQAQHTGNWSYDGSLLEYYYKNFPETASDRLGLPKNRKRAKLDALGPFSVCFPWDGGFGSGQEQRYLKQRFNEMASHEVACDLSGSNTNELDPVSDNVGRWHAQRLQSIFNSISENDYRVERSKNHIRASLLFSGSVLMASVVRSGHHRSAALAALGVEEIPLLVKRGEIVMREDVDIWPAVKSGDITREDALFVFDRVAAGQASVTLG